MNKFDISVNALLGQAVGDAFGVPVEFLSRVRVRALDLREMQGSDSDTRIVSRWDMIPKGSWSDDTSMTVASLASFIDNGGKIDYEDQMSRFVRWWDKGEYCCLSYPFGLGGNVSASMKRFQAGVPALECGGKDYFDNGNGALMRILPFSLYCIFNQLDMDETVKITGNGSTITHGHEISRMCCFIWTEFLRVLAKGAGVNEAIEHIEGLPYRKWFSDETLEEVDFVTERKVRNLTEDDIGETGYVVDTLYSALFSLNHANDFEMSIRNAVNLGYDTDTAGVVTGMAAGILYGVDSIPPLWLDALGKRKYLADMAWQFASQFTD